MSIKPGQDANASDFAFLLGVVLPYAGASAPSGWQLCDGSALTMNAASDLFDVIFNQFGDGGATTFTANSSTDFLTAVAHGMVNGDIFYITNSGGALPTGLSTDLKYFVINKTDDTFQVALVSGGGAVDFSTAGSGTHSFHEEFLVPDMRGNFPLGKDDMGSSSRDRVTHANADILGGEEGAETHQLTTAEMPSHTHGRVLGASNDTAINADAGSSWLETAGVTASTGGDTPHENMPPYMTLNYIIRTAA